jgi:hypothetical protein
MVKDTRHSLSHTRRRRQCLVCAYRFTTLELVVTDDHGSHQLTVPMGIRFGRPSQDEDGQWKEEGDS